MPSEALLFFFSRAAAVDREGRPLHPYSAVDQEGRPLHPYSAVDQEGRPLHSYFVSLSSCDRSDATAATCCTVGSQSPSSTATIKPPSVSLMPARSSARAEPDAFAAFHAPYDLAMSAEICCSKAS